MDRLKRSHFLDELTGEVFLSQYDAMAALTEILPDSGKLPSLTAA